MKGLLLIQCCYYFLTGIWPLVHLKSFLKVTGPKKETWLVKTAGLLIVAISLAFFASLITGITLPVIVLALVTSFFLLYIDLYYTIKSEIATVYLLDALPELIFSVIWIYFLITNLKAFLHL